MENNVSYVTNIEQQEVCIVYIAHGIVSTMSILIFSNIYHLFNFYHLKWKEPNMDSVVSSPTS